MEEVNDLMRERRRKLDALRAAGVNPYGGKVEGLRSVASVMEPFTPGVTARVAGRLLSWRSFGKANFTDLQDSTGKVQLYIKSAELTESEQKVIELIDIGDIGDHRRNVRHQDRHEQPSREAAAHRLQGAAAPAGQTNGTA